MDRVVFWMFLWLIPTLSLNKIKIELRLLLFGVSGTSLEHRS
jgi:hypothetical protein